MTDEAFTIMDGKVHVYRREGSKFWQCSTYLNRRNHRATTKEENSALAKAFAREWYMERYVEARRERRGEYQTHPYPPLRNQEPLIRQSAPRSKQIGSKTFREAAEKFLQEYEIITHGQRNKDYAKSHDMRLRVHLLPYFATGQVKWADQSMNSRTQSSLALSHFRTCGLLEDWKM